MLGAVRGRSLVPPESPSLRRCAASKYLDLLHVRPATIDPSPYMIVRLLGVLADGCVEYGVVLSSRQRCRSITAAAQDQHLVLVPEPAAGPRLFASALLTPDLIGAVPPATDRPGRLPVRSAN